MDFCDDYEYDREYYVQCRLKKDDCFQISWIPENFAIKGKVLKICHNNIWENGWVVESAGHRAFQGSVLDRAMESQINIVCGWRKREREHRQSIAKQDRENSLKKKARYASG